ncbi:MAG: outer membrane beta-barrel protein [Flavobacteriales bacterium]
MTKFIFSCVFALLFVFEGFSQYQIRHQFTLGLNSTNLYARSLDTDEIRVNYEIDDQDKEKYRANTQNTLLDFETEATQNWFIGYRLTLDFNQRYSIDLGAIVSKWGYTTKISKEHWGDLEWDEIYTALAYFPLKKRDYRYDEDFEDYRIEIPVLFKKNINSFVAAYAGFNGSVSLKSSDEFKPIGTRSISDNNINVEQYITDNDVSVGLVGGLDALFGQRFSIFAQGEYSLRSIDQHRESKIRFVAVKIGLNYVFLKR